MKKLLFILLWVIGINQLLSAQVYKDTTRPVILSDRDLGLKYLRKGNNLKIAGFALLVAGSACFIGAAATIWDNYKTSDGLLYLGIGLTIASAPLFIGAAKNRGRAEILLRHENIRVFNNHGSGKEGLVSLGLTIPIGRSHK
jgi:hypothetical protein